MIIKNYCSVEFSVSSSDPIHLFGIRDVSSSGIGILVKEDSSVLKHLRVGDVINIKYNPAIPSDLPENLDTKIIHITKADQETFKGHYWIGLSIL